VDQNGEKTSDVKRLYANPIKPELCVILQLAVHTWCKSNFISPCITTTKDIYIKYCIFIIYSFHKEYLQIKLY
jgi:hypothetical protein